MKYKIQSFFFFLNVCFVIAGYSQSTSLKLWYDKPAGDVWEAALPVGNGRLAAMVYGNPDHERIQLNESTVWSGSPYRNDNPNALKALPEIRELIFEGKNEEASKLAAQNIQTKTNGMKYQTVGSLWLNFPGHDKFENYYRELNLETAVVKSVYTVDGVKFTREVFASVPDQVIVIHLSADKPQSLSFITGISSPLQSSIAVDKNNILILDGITDSHEGIKGMIKFRSLVKIKTKGGHSAFTDTTINITHADEADIYISIATNFINYHDISGNEQKKAAAYLQKISAGNYPGLLARHINSYQKYFNRVKLDLGRSEAEKKPTDV